MTSKKFFTKSFLSAVYAILLIGASVTASAATDIFLKIEGVDGESAVKGHEGSIDILSWSWGLSQTGTIGTSGAGAGKVSMQDFHFTKYIDKSSPQLMLKTSSGEPIPTLVLTIFRSQGDSSVPYLKIQLHDVLVSSLVLGGSDNEDRFQEQVSFNFSKIEFEYYPPTSDGNVPTPIKYGWDLATNTKI